MIFALEPRHGLFVALLLGLASRADELDARTSVEALTSSRGAWPRENDLNPGNGVLRLDQLGLHAELRPSLRLEYGSRLAFLVRPRLRGLVAKARVDGEWKPEHSTASAEWTELYATLRLSDSALLAYGLQNFQWGPAESLSPSNRLFHETGLLRDPLYSVKGRHLVRLNLSVGRQWSAVLLAEVGPTGQPTFLAGESFEPKGQLKVEYAAESGSNYFGVTAGAGERSRPWWGEYGQFEPVEGLVLFADAVHLGESKAFYPVDTPLGPGFAQTKLGQDVLLGRLYTLVVGGARYTFEDGAELRAEYVFNEAGWNREAVMLAADAARNRAWLPPWLYPGLEQLGEQVLYASARVPELAPAKRLTLQLRYAYSLTDRSGAAFALASLEVGEAALVFLSVHASHGPGHGEFARLTRGSAAAGLSYTW